MCCSRIQFLIREKITIFKSHYDEQKTTFLSHITLLTFSLLLSNALAQDYTTWSLPDGAKARLGKGDSTGNIAFSPDGNILASGSGDGTVLFWEIR